MIVHTKYTLKDKEYWLIVIGLGFASIFVFSALYSMQPILPILKTEFKVSTSLASLGMSIATIGLIGGLFISGFLSDRKGRTIFILTSIFLSTLLLFIIPLVNSFGMIIVLRFLQGFTLSGVLGSALAYMAEEIDQKYLSFATTLYIAANSIGSMFGRFFISYIAESFGWKNALFIVGGIGIVVFFLVFFTMPKSKFFKQLDTSLSEDLGNYFYHLKNPSLLLLFGLGAVLQMSFTGMWTYLPFYLIEPPYELTLQQIAYFYLAYSLGVIGAPIAGALTNRFSLSSMRIIGVIVLSTGMLLTLGESIFIITIGLCVICLGFFVSHSIATTTVTQEAKAFKGSASSLYLITYYLGVAFGTTGLAPLWERFAWTGIITFTTLVPLIYVIIVKLIRSRLQKDTVES